MRILFDTNVIIAAFITRGVCGDLLDHCIRHHVLITSEFILNEFKENLTHKFRYTDEEVQEAIELIRLRMEMVKPKMLKEPICRDPDDDMILGTALAGDVKCIITGDKDLLVLRSYETFDIISPREFESYESESLI